MFVQLRNHSHYSLLKALPKVDELVGRALSLKMESLAITDYSNMYGAIEFYKECKKNGIKPIIGVEFTIKHSDRLFQIVLIAKSLTGYKNLMKITSVINTENSISPVLTDEILVTYKDDLIVLSGGNWGDVSNLLLINESNAHKRVEFYKEHFGTNYFLELNPQRDAGSTDLLRSKTIECARMTNAPLVATWNTHYIHSADKSAHKTLYLVHGTDTSLEEYNNFFQK